VKRTFHLRPPRGPFDDPFCYLRFFHTGRALLFDLGDLSPLSSRDLMRVTDVFVTHAHMDHFTGFDRLLRVHLQRSRTLRVYGPAGFLGHMEGKFNAYSWNLSAGYPLSVLAFETDGTEVRTAAFHARTGFKREDGEDRNWKGVFLEEPGFRVRGQILDHGIPCLGFRLEEKISVRIRSGEFQRRGLVPGSWITDLKTAVAEGNPPSTMLRVETLEGLREMSLEELRELWTVAEGAILTYVVDTTGDPSNLAKIITLAQNSDLLYIEAAFLSEDAVHAAEKKHLTAAAAGQIASLAKVGMAKLIHISPRYEGKESLLLKEASDAAGRGCRIKEGWKR